MNDGILVLAGKEVGAALVAYLVAENADVRRVVISSLNDTTIMQICSRAQIRCSIYEPETQNRIIDEATKYHWLLNLWSPHILKPAFLALANCRLNIHPSLLPHCQGSDSSAWCIRKNLPAGVSLIEMADQVDIGGIYAQREVAVPFPTKGRDLHVRLQQEAISLFTENWKDIEAGQIRPRPQSGEVTRYTRKSTNQDRLVVLESTVEWKQCIDWMLAHDFSPGTTAEIEYGGRRYRLTLNVEEIVIGSRDI